MPSSKRLYNWNTTHFYPDIHKLDSDRLPALRQRRHSEPLCFLHFADGVSHDQQPSGSSSSLASFDEVKDRHDAIMPVSQLTVQLSAPHTACSTARDPIAKVDVDLDSSSDSEDDAPKMWHRSPLHVWRGRRSGVDRHSGKKTNSSHSLSADGTGEPWKQVADRPSVKCKEQAEKRRKFLQQRCQMYGWDLTADEERQSVEDEHTEERRECATSQPQEDMCFIDDFPENSFVNQDSIEHGSANTASVHVKDSVRQFDTSETLIHVVTKDNNQHNEQRGRLPRVNSNDKPSAKSTSTNMSVKESSSFENIYDTVSLEPDKSSDNVEVVQLYEPRQAVCCHAEPLPSNKLPQTALQPSVRLGSYRPNDRNDNLSNTADTSVNVAACSARPSSAPSKSTQKAGLDARSIVEEEKLKFVEYRIEYRRQHSSGNESVSGKSDGEKDVRRQPEPTTKPQTAIPPDDYEYILRKIHYNRPQNKTDQKPSASKPSSTNRGSELHMIKKPQVATQHITVDVARPSVPHRVESLQHSGLHHMHARPDVIPSPNYPPSPNMIAADFGDGAGTGRDLNIHPDKPSRTVLRSDHPSVSTEPSTLPAPVENSVYRWDDRIRTPYREHFGRSKVQYVEASSINSQNTEPCRKPPKPPREELSGNQIPELWNYNTTYEASSPSLQPQQSRSMLSKEREMQHTSKTELKDSAKLRDQDLVRDLVHGLDKNAKLTPEATAVFREQYRWSIHEPCHSVKPDQLNHGQLPQLPCSQVFASSVCVPSKPLKLVDQITQPSLKDSDRVRSRKETVFSVTGYHRLQEQNTDGLSEDIRRKDDQLYPRSSHILDSHSNDAVVETKPLYWYSEADKRKPIIHSPEVETALNRDCRQRYVYCSGQQVDGQNLTWENSRNGRQCSEVSSGLVGWKHGPCHRDNCAERDMHKDVRILGQKCQDRLVQQMSLGNQEVTGHLHSDSSCCATSIPVSGPRNIRVRPPSDNVNTEKSSSNELCGQPLMEVDHHKGIQSLKTPDHVLSRASADYEKHISRGKESYHSQVMAQIEPSTVAASCTVQDRILNARNCQNMASISTSQDVFIGCNAGRMAGSEVGMTRHDNGTPGKSCLTNQEKREMYEDEDPYPMSVAEIKAKLFGPDEDGARRLFRQQGDAVKGSQTGRAGGGTLNQRVGYPNSEQKKRSFTSDELTDFEKLVERLDKGDMPSESHSEWCRVSPTVSGVQNSSTDDPTVKHLSITNIQMLEGNRGNQSPSLEYAKDWLISGRRASASATGDRSSEHLLSSYTVEGNPTQLTGRNVLAAESVGNFISYKSMKSLPHTKSGDVFQPVVASNVNNMNGVTKSRTHSSAPMEGSTVFRSHPAGPLSSFHGSSSNSFARRSLPVLTEKDAERWQNMVSRIQENESRKEAKSRSVERLSQPNYDLEMQMPVGMLAAASDKTEHKLAVMAQPSLHSTSDSMIPTDPVSMKAKRQQTPRDVKCRDESRMKSVRPIHASTADSGYLDGGSDSHGSSGTDVSKRLPSESNESDELELQRYTCDEDDDIKLSIGSLSVANVDSVFTLADKTSAPEMSMSEYKMSSKFQESRAKQLQKVREDWFSKNIQQSHSSSLPDKSDSLNISQSHAFNNDAGYEHSESSQFGRTVPLSLGLPKEKSAKPLYISPLVQTSCSGIYRTPPSVVTTGGDDRSCATVGFSPSKVSSFKMMFPSQGPGQNTGSDGKSSVSSQSSKVTHIPVRASAGFLSGQSLARGSAFSPYVEHKDLQTSRTSIGGANVTEMKKEQIQVQPEQYKASRLLERTVEQQSLKTYQRESEQFKHERQEVKEPNVKITKRVTDSRIERTYRIESHPQPTALQLLARNEWDKCETSDGEMTDATDITLDVMVGANQSLTPAVDAVDFSDVEFLSSANLPAKYDTGFTKCSAEPCVSRPFNENLGDARRIQSHEGSGDATMAAAKAELELYKKNKRDAKAGGEPPVERRRSIKELVHSFEGMTSPFMRARPRSMEIQISSSSEEENQYDDVNGRKHKNTTLRASSSFKEATRLDRRNRHQATVNQ